MSEQSPFVTLVSKTFGEGGFLKAEVMPNGEEITIQTERWFLNPGKPEKGAWVSGSVKFLNGVACEVLLTLHDADDSEPWCSLGPMAPHQVAQDFEFFLPYVRARAIRPLRDLEEKLRRARYAAWVAEPGDQAARSAVKTAADELTAHGGQPDLAWPNPTHDGNGNLL